MVILLKRDAFAAQCINRMLNIINPERACVSLNIGFSCFSLCSSAQTRLPWQPARWGTALGCAYARFGVKMALLPTTEGCLARFERAEAQRRPDLVDRNLPDWSHAVLIQDWPERIAVDVGLVAFGIGDPENDWPGQVIRVRAENLACGCGCIDEDQRNGCLLHPIHD